MDGASEEYDRRPLRDRGQRLLGVVAVKATSFSGFGIGIDIG